MTRGREACRFDDPGDSSSTDWLRFLLPGWPKPAKRGNLDDDDFSCVLRCSFAFSTSVLLSSRKPPASVGAAVVSGLVEEGSGTSSMTLPCDLRRAVKRPRPGLPIVMLATVCRRVEGAPNAYGGRSQCAWARSYTKKARDTWRCGVVRCEAGAVQGEGRSERVVVGRASERASANG